MPCGYFNYAEDNLIPSFLIFIAALKEVLWDNMFKYLNLNPKGRNVSDCTVRAFALARGISWYEAYDILSSYARDRCIVIDDVTFIDDFLMERYDYECLKCDGLKITVRELCERYHKGTYLITMSGHITCMIDGTIYDTWNPSDKYAWRIWKVS